MNFEIREIPRNEQYAKEVFSVCKTSFADIDYDKLKTNWFDSNSESVFFGAFAGNTLAAVNGFLAHSVINNGRPSLVFQSCWSATLPEFRGKGLFSMIINHAKAALTERADFLCGFPNHVSRPIFIGKLGFKEVELSRVYFMTRGPLQILQWQIDSRRCHELNESNSMMKFNQYDISSWKKSEHASKFLEVEHNTNYIWGVVSERRVLNMPVHMLLMGGCEINKPKLFGELMRSVGRVGNVSLARAVCSKGGILAESSRISLSGSRTEPFIYFPLKNSDKNISFDVSTGLKDVF